MLTLLGRANSSNVRKVLWTLAELDLAYERKDYGRGFEPTDAQEFQRVNPAGLVPALIDNDLLIGESNTIVRYLCRKAEAEHLLPSDAKALARVEHWMDWQGAEMVRPFRILFMGGHLNHAPFNTTEHQSLALAEATKFLGVLDRQLERTGGYVCGETFTAADLAIGMYVHRWFALDIARPELEHVTRYCTQLQQRPAYTTHVDNGLP
ncbi:MAG: glutathione S-transferase family protein [Pseudomonadota bacterium]